MIYHVLLTHCFRKTPGRVVLQTVKTQMKCSIISSVSTLFVKVKKIFRQKNTIFVENYNLTPRDTMLVQGLSQAYCIKPEGSIL